MADRRTTPDRRPRGEPRPIAHPLSIARTGDTGFLRRASDVPPQALRGHDRAVAGANPPTIAPHAVRAVHERAHTPLSTTLELRYSHRMLPLEWNVPTIRCCGSARKSAEAHIV